MKTGILKTAALLAATGATAFPSMLLKDLPSTEELVSKLTPRQLEEFDQITDQIIADLDWNEKNNDNQKRDSYADRLVDVHGEHRFIAPGPGDRRGPCPGLNSLANHGYISRDGITNVLESGYASNHVFGMGIDFSHYLSLYSAVMSGDLVSFSIGGPPPDGLLDTVGLGLLGKPMGLSFSHNRFEADVSPTRADLHDNNNPSHNVWDVNLDIVKTLYQKELGPNGYDLSVMIPWRGERFWNSVHTNPWFWRGPYTTFAVETATFLFTYAFFGNWSEDATDGYLSRETYMTFLGVTGDSVDTLQVNPGHERIPENFYKRPTPYMIPNFAIQAVQSLQELPNLLVLGGNTGEVDTFTGFNISGLTDGVFNAETLLEGDNLMCFAFQSVTEFAPDMLRGLLANLAGPLAKLSTITNSVLSGLDCPQLRKFDKDLVKQYPGAKGAYY